VIVNTGRLKNSTARRDAIPLSSFPGQSGSGHQTAPSGSSHQSVSRNPTGTGPEQLGSVGTTLDVDLGLVWEPRNRSVFSYKPVSLSTRVRESSCELGSVWKPTRGESVTRVGASFHGQRKHTSEGRTHSTHRASNPHLASFSVS
jgi:hypothetical protein